MILACVQVNESSKAQPFFFYFWICMMSVRAHIPYMVVSEAPPTSSSVLFTRSSQSEASLKVTKTQCEIRDMRFCSVNHVKRFIIGPLEFFIADGGAH